MDIYKEIQEAVKAKRVLAPHCDASVLHKENECEWCDMFPSYQEYRKLSRINFTGEHDPNKAPCPSTYFRDEETINLWGGNRAKKK